MLLIVSADLPLVRSKAN